MITQDKVSTIVFDKIVHCIYKHPVSERPELLKKVLEYKLKPRLGKGRSRTAGHLGCRMTRKIGGAKIIQKDTLHIALHLSAINGMLGKNFNGRIVKTMDEAIETTIEHEVVHFMHMVLKDGPSDHSSQFKKLAKKYFDHTDSKIR